MKTINNPCNNVFKFIKIPQCIICYAFLENTIQNLMHNIHSKSRMIKTYVKHKIQLLLSINLYGKRPKRYCFHIITRVTNKRLFKIDLSFCCIIIPPQDLLHRNSNMLLNQFKLGKITFSQINFGDGMFCISASLRASWMFYSWHRKHVFSDFRIKGPPITCAGCVERLSARRQGGTPVHAPKQMVFNCPCYCQST